MKMLSRSEIRIRPSGGIDVDSTLKPLESLTMQNNLADQLSKRKYHYCTAPSYMPDVPRLISCKYGVYSKRTVQLIMDNRERERYLPLKIMKSKIPRGGQGVFATVPIPAGTIITSYLGEICTNESATSNDSLFTLGWIRQKCLMICPVNYSNVARFINSSDVNNNCKCEIGLLRYTDKEESEKGENYEICVVISTTKHVDEGEELKYNYGSYYPLQHKKNSLEDE